MEQHRLVPADAPAFRTTADLAKAPRSRMDPPAPATSPALPPRPRPGRLGAVAGRPDHPPHADGLPRLRPPCLGLPHGPPPLEGVIPSESRQLAETLRYHSSTSPSERAREVQPPPHLSLSHTLTRAWPQPLTAPNPPSQAPAARPGNCSSRPHHQRRRLANCQQQHPSFRGRRPAARG